jgi:hypothetical protein
MPQKFTGSQDDTYALHSLIDQFIRARHLNEQC